MKWLDMVIQGKKQTYRKKQEFFISVKRGKKLDKNKIVLYYGHLMFHKMKMTAELLLLPGKKSMPIVMALLIMLTYNF